MTNINIVFSSDNNFSQHLASTISSIVANKYESTHIDFYVIDGGITEINKSKIYMIAESQTTTLLFCTPNLDTLNKLITKDHLKSATYYRLAIPDILPKEVEKVLYLDCDMIVTGDLSEVYLTSLPSPYVVAAIKDPLGYTRKHVLGIPSEYDYFNAGFMLINLSERRKSDISEKVIKYIQENPEKILRCDQDGLNKILYNRWFVLEETYNFQHTYKLSNKKKYIGIIKEYSSEKKTPMIIHYSSSRKPWLLGGYHPMRDEYFKYLAMTPWKIDAFQKLIYRIGDPFFMIKSKFINLIKAVYKILLNFITKK